jgi:uncharacterized Tic20 family protein
MREKSMLRMRSLLFGWLAFAALIGPVSADWPTLHRDGQRSGYTDEVLERTVGA